MSYTAFDIRICGKTPLKPQKASILAGRLPLPYSMHIDLDASNPKITRGKIKNSIYLIDPTEREMQGLLTDGDVLETVKSINMAYPGLPRAGAVNVRIYPNNRKTLTDFEDDRNAVKAMRRNGMSSLLTQARVSNENGEKGLLDARTFDFAGTFMEYMISDLTELRLVLTDFDEEILYWSRGTFLDRYRSLVDKNCNSP